MRATFISPCLDTYGGDRVIGRYAHGLSARGHDVRVVSVGEPKSTLFYEGLNTITLGHDAFPRSKVDYLRAGWSLVRRVQDPGVIIPTWTPTLPLAVVLKATREGRRTVWLAQDYVEMFAGLPMELWLLEAGAGYCDAVITISTLCAEQLHAERHPGKVTIIHSGVDDVFFFDGVPSERSEALLFIGDPIPRKGWREFVTAWEGLRATHPNLAFVIVCRKPPKDELPEGGTCLVGLSDEEVAEQYRRAAVYVCASHAEGWGLPALEAMASGTPVVTTLHGGCEAYARDGLNCLTVPVADPLALQQGIARILSDRALRERLIRAGRDTAGQYAWPSAIDRFEAVCAG